MLKTVDLFAGCGGMSLGFSLAGFEIVSAYDNWPLAVSVYRRNFVHPIIEVDLSDRSSISGISMNTPGLIIGGPPCQDFSSAGHRNEQLGRADLTVSYAGIVAEIQPTFFVMENVPRIAKSQVLADVRHTLKSRGYGLTEVVLDASLCGVPQARKRYFMIGSRLDSDGFLHDSLIDNLASRRMTVFDYFGDSLGFEHYFRVPRSYQRRGVFSIHEPAPTVRGVDRPVPNGYPGHPGDTAVISDEIRTLTIHERALFQTFPSSFVWEGPKSHINQMIGNAVPVNLARYVATRLMNHIELIGGHA